MKNRATLFICLLLSLHGMAAVKDVNISKYGAKADGRTINTKIIQQLIDKVSAGGGGRVIIPPGNFMTGTLFIKTGVDLHLELTCNLRLTPIQTQMLMELLTK